MSNYHRGPWVDRPESGLDPALREVGLDLADFIECQYSAGSVLVPVDPAGEWEVDVEFFYSALREQYRAVLRRRPHYHHDASEQQAPFPVRQA